MVKSTTATWAEKNNVVYIGGFVTPTTLRAVVKVQKKLRRSRQWVLQRVLLHGLNYPPPGGFGES